MPVKNYVHQIELTPPEQLDNLVENRRVFNLQNCEFNIFESYQAGLQRSPSVQRSGYQQHGTGQKSSPHL